VDSKMVCAEQPPVFRVSDSYDIMSDMVSNRITVRIPQALSSRLRSRSQAQGTTESDLVRQALENYLEHSAGERSAYELAEEAGIIGCARRAARDLSTNPRHFKGFGKRK
jgi:predicted DNA-binding protein